MLMHSAYALPTHCVCMLHALTCRVGDVVPEEGVPVGADLVLEPVDEVQPCRRVS